MNKKILIILLVIIFAVLAFFALKPREQEAPQTQPSNNSSNPIPSLSPDKKSIVANGKVVLSVDDPVIFDFFKKAESGLCDSSNIDNTPTRRSFCLDKATFRAKTSFSKVTRSSNNNAIGFTIETTELTPDTVTGIFLPKNKLYKVHILTNYYLGNDFLSFSPSGSRFVFKEGCFEAMCGFTIKETNTLETVRHFGNPELEPNNIFVRWLSDTSIEYKVGNETKQTLL